MNIGKENTIPSAFYRISLKLVIGSQESIRAQIQLISFNCTMYPQIDRKESNCEYDVHFS